MEIKISAKDGEKELSFKFSGNPQEVIEGACDRVSAIRIDGKTLADHVRSWLPDD